MAKPPPTAADFYNQIFDATKYKANDIGKRKNVPYADGSDEYANNKKMYISFLHVPSNKSVFFKAFITSFNETYTPNWRSEEVFGRADPIHSFVQTQRAINLTFVAPAASESEAYENLAKTQNLIQFLYPNYTDVQKAQTISQGPLLRLKVMNLLQDMSGQTTTSDQTSFADLKAKSKYYTEYKSNGTDPHQGLLGFISSFTVNHNIENREAGVFVKENETNTILPKMIEIVVSFTPIHEHGVGWEGDTFKEQLFPYGTSLYDTAKMTNGADGKTWDEAESIKNNRDTVEQAKLAAEARYARGLLGLGGISLEKDIARLKSNSATGAERDYLLKTVAGAHELGYDRIPHGDHTDHNLDGHAALVEILKPKD
jgi:hypothetical protein